MGSATISPEQIVHEFTQAYKVVNDHEPKINYVGNGWFQVNGEAVHHVMLMQEVERLKHLAEVQRMRSPKTSAIQRLINKLRFM